MVILLSAFTFWGWFRGTENVISWDVITELKEKAIQTPALYFDQFSFSATTPLWYVTESYAPSPLKINGTAYVLLLAGILAGVSLILAGLSRLRGAWFLAGALLLGVVLSSFRLESIFLVSRNWPFLAAFGLAGGTYFLTNLYARKLDIVKTCLIWLGVWLVFSGAVKWLSVINEPFLSVAAFGVTGGLVITFIFIFLVSHEILAALYGLVSRNSEKGKNNLLQLLVVTAVFLVNAVLIYLENAQRIDKSSFVVPPLLLYFFSMIAGWWGFRNLSGQRSWFSFPGVGAWLYLGMALTATATLGMAYATANTPLTELLEDYISIAFLSTGLCFFVYTGLNFWPLIKAGLPFHKVIYKPPFSPFLLARVAAVFVIFFLFSLKNRYSYFQLRAGISNAIGDFYLEEGDFRSAEAYYKNGADYDLNNQRSNLSLASMAEQAGDRVSATYFYQQAGAKKPNAVSIIGKSRNLEQQDMFFDAVFLLKEGVRQFPEDHRLYTTLAHLQARAGMTDSVLLNLDRALQLCKNCGPENVNFLAFWIENGRPEKLAEMQALAGKPDSYSFLANRAALERLTGAETVVEKFGTAPDSSLDMGRAAYLLNAMSSVSLQNKAGITSESLRTFREKPANDALYEQLLWASANQKYYRENKTEGIRQLISLAESSSRLVPLYNQNLGLWLMREGVYSEALKRLEKAGDTSSVRLLSGGDLKAQMDEKLRAQAEQLAGELTLENREELLNKAPLNPWFLVKAADFLSKNNKSQEAYNTVFYALEFLPDSPVLLASYIRKALDLSMTDYAEDALVRARMVMSDAEFWPLENQVEEARKKSRDFN